jgi:hypothetical protein
MTHARLRDGGNEIGSRDIERIVDRGTNRVVRGSPMSRNVDHTGSSAATGQRVVA